MYILSLVRAWDYSALLPMSLCLRGAAALSCAGARVLAFNGSIIYSKGESDRNRGMIRFETRDLWLIQFVCGCGGMKEMYSEIYEYDPYIWVY